MARRVTTPWESEVGEGVLTLVDDLLEGLPLDAVPQLELLRDVLLPQALLPPTCHCHLTRAHSV